MARPTRYKKEFAEQAKKLCRLGATDSELADFFGCTEKTINNWKKRHAEFLQSIKEGKLTSDAEVADKLFKRATGYSHRAVKIMQFQGVPVVQEYTEHYPPDATSMIFWLRNRRPDLWRNNPEPMMDDDLPPTRVIHEVVDGRKSDSESADDSSA